MVKIEADGERAMPDGSQKKLKKADDRRQILGVGVSSTDLNGVLTKIANFITSSHKSGPAVVVTVNPEFVMIAQNDLEFRSILNSADLAIADGQGLRLAEPSLKIVPGRRVVQKLVESTQYKIYYLGGAEGVTEAMVKKFGGKGESGHKNVQVSLTDPEISEKIVKNINSYKPDIVLVAYGAPWQEKWIWANKDKVQAKVMMGVGGSFDYLIGKAALPPKWMEKMGLEWLWRLIREPRRWRRQLALIRFIGAVLTS